MTPRRVRSDSQGRRIGGLFLRGRDPFPDSEGYSGVFLGATACGWTTASSRRATGLCRRRPASPRTGLLRPSHAAGRRPRRVGDETHYEITIPWRELDPKLSGPPQEKLFGFGILVNDIDLLDGFRSERKAMGPIGTFSPSPELGVIVLE